MSDAGAVDAEPTVLEACTPPTAAPVRGDVNGDGLLDVADPIALEDHLFRGGPEPACRAAADFDQDGAVEGDDATRMTTYMVNGQLILDGTFSEDRCPDPHNWPNGTCAPLELVWNAPMRVEAAAFEAQVQLRSPLLAISGWSASMFAEGCTITGVTTERTPAAEIWDDPPGVRHLGYAATRPVTGGAISFVILSFHEDIALGPSSEPIPLLHVAVEGPAGGCSTCTLTLGSGLAWTGQPMPLAVVSGGLAYAPRTDSAAIEVCAP